MKAERWQQISRLYHAALACEGDRAAFLKQACADDEELRLDVESMLAHQASAEAFLTSPAWRIANIASDSQPGDVFGEPQAQAAALKEGLADRYRIGSELGRGGMAIVYLADDLKHGRKVAIKTLHAEMAATIGHQRFLREIEIAARLTHPHILPLHDSGEVNGQLYYVMPYIEGESLRVRLDREKPISIEAALRLTREIASALEYAHQHGVVHRDIKPGNVLLADGIALVADFGIARAVKASIDQQTTTGIIVGTPVYMSPEQAAGRGEVDARSDIYSLGCVLYEMLAGEPPFTGSSAMAVLAQHALEDVPPLKTRRSEITDGLERVVQKSLAKSPADRYPTAVSFAEALSEATVRPTAASQHDIDIPESRARPIQVLTRPAGEQRVPFMADVLPEDFVARPAVFDALKRRLLDARGEPVAITAALRGAGGYGKTVLANALCHDSDIQDAFSDGILRITLGEKPDDLAGRIADLIETLTGTRPGFRTLDAAKVALADALDDRRCLLVIDDAWRVQDVAPFLHRGPRNQTTRLVTTRDDRIVPPDAARIAVDAMTVGEAQEMLSRGMPAPIANALQPRLAALAGQLGEWPLLLGLANGVVRARMARGASPADALAYAERAIAQRGIATAFQPDDREWRRRTARGTLEVSLEQFEVDERTRFSELAVFVEDAEIPTTLAIGLWRQTAELDPLDGEDLLARLADLSLLWELDLGRGVLRLHDIMRTLLREGPAKGRLTKLDGLLVAHFRAVSEGRLAELSDVYGLRYLLAHLSGAGEVDVARALLADPAWLSNKLQRLGIQPLLADYATLSHRDGALDLIRAALTLAVSALARNPRELAPQLLARLAPGDAPGLDEFLMRTRRVLSAYALVPSRPTFTPPGAELRRFEGHEVGVTSVTVLADGRRALSGSHDQTLRLWDLETGAELRRFTITAQHAVTYVKGHENYVTSLTGLADGRRALSGSRDGTLRLWDLETGAERRRFEGHENYVTSVAALPDGRRALSGSRDRTVRLWDLETGAELRRFAGHKDGVTSVTGLADGRRALSGSSDRTLRLWDLETGAELRRFEGHDNAVTSVTGLADGRRALSGSWDFTLRLWDLETGAELRRFKGHENYVTSVAALPDGRRALSGSWDFTLRLWDLETGAELRRFKGHENYVTSVTGLADGRRALSGSHDRTLRLWDLEASARLCRFEEHEGAVTSVTVLADGRRALSGSNDRTLRLWDLETGAELRRFEGHEGVVSGVTVLADGRRALSGSYDRTLRLWDLETGAELRRIERHEGAVTSVTVLADGQRALSGSDDWTLRLWDLETGAELRRFEGHKYGVTSVTGLADGRRALSGSWDGTLRLWDLETGAELRRFAGHQDRVTSVTGLADGRRALSGSWDGTLRLWDLETGAELRRFEGHQDGVKSVTVLADGRRALSGSKDQTLRLWDLETEAELARLTFDASTGAVAWSPTRRRAVVGDARGRVHVVDVIE